ncbi:MAG TPA: glycerophosphodiester phosphodiesterase family protein [Geothermobacteraceae bacterium]|nr:glycerophosphodiester phosphodiesterase family protein [Geothermobacteraceae bacterium]
MSDFLLWAHRGASADAPENTLAAFALAEQQRADGIELDVQLSRDGVPLILHDEILERTTDGRGRVDQQNWSELRKLDAGSWFGSEFAGERLPSLAEVLEWADDRLLLNLEVKTPSVADALLRLLKQFPWARVLISSFDHRLLAALRNVAPDLRLGFLNDSRFWRRALQRATRARAVSFHPRVDQVSRPLLAACQAAELAVYPWTVDSAVVAHRLRGLGVAGVFSNRPGLLRRELFLN